MGYVARRLVLVAVVAVAVAVAPIATAQSTGGRMGGSRGFGSSGGGRSSSSRSSSGWSSSRESSGSSSWSRRSRSSRRETSSSPDLSSRPPERVPEGPAEPRRAASLSPPAEHPEIDRYPARLPARGTVRWMYGMYVRPDVPLYFGCCGLGVAVFLALFVPLQRRAGRRARLAREERERPCEVRRISLAFDWTRRRDLQSALVAMAGRHDLDRADGMGAFAREVVGALRGAIEAARYGAWQTFRESPEGAEAKVARLELDLASRFTRDVVRGDRMETAPAMEARPEEGAGLVVISLVIGTMVRSPALPDRLDAAGLSRALDDALPGADEDLVAFHVVWSPAVEDDRMSSLELESRYPELLRLDEDAALGRGTCAYCRAVFPQELAACPACGAPAPSPPNAEAPQEDFNIRKEG